VVNSIRGENTDSVSLAIGAPVYLEAVAATAQYDFKRAKADTATTSKCIGFVASGLVQASWAAAAQGFMTYAGVVTIASAVVTGTWVFNDKIYLDPATAGKLTNVVPTTSGQFIVPLGRVLEVFGGGGATMLIEKEPVVEIP
jgi:hypothetical protein